MLLNRIDRILITTIRHWGIGNDGRSAMDGQGVGKVHGVQRKHDQPSGLPVARKAANVAAFRREGMG